MNKETPPPYTESPQYPPPPGMYPPPPSTNMGPPLQPMQPPHPQPQTNVIITTAQIVSLGPTTKYMICPSCHHQIHTEVKTEPNTKTHLFALLLCLFQCYFCCCIPYCVDSCQSQNHYCPNCGSFIGGYDN